MLRGGGLVRTGVVAGVRLGAKYTNWVFNIVPHREAWVVERFGRFHEVLEPGLRILVPLLHRIKYKHSLKQVAVAVRDQRAITQDNVLLAVDGVLYYQVVDPVLASYGIEDVHYAITQLAESTMRSELGKMSLDRTFEERTLLNESIVSNINAAAKEWGVVCKRYEIRDITPPHSVVQAMELQVAAERRKRATVLDSEGVQQSRINVAQGQRTAMILESEGHKSELINSAKGKAEAIIANAEASAASILMLAKAVASQGGKDAVGLKLAEEYVEAFGKLAASSNTMLLPTDANDVSAMVAKALTMYGSISKSHNGADGAVDPTAASPDAVLDELAGRTGSVLAAHHSASEDGDLGDSIGLAASIPSLDELTSAADVDPLLADGDHVGEFYDNPQSHGEQQGWGDPDSVSGDSRRQT
ncbi:erythrocyte band 7 integral membrane protein [Thecamonas trahens ATCC 50062]|uniref:Erythrocyte band 7 integral membrane protein n=1 Tax=Thecamonas trahens ATCC 50062 TaxID=461836 RepID=A0A0L0DNV6_THETB|nr:erythrocyte band 7 integral membrane protein [Thecamonas trahens ATCC 50062]KNC53950.1 erythrocyte band 7 integral membrane protein [Thecamonas trahens ATCC 50062]|eukprot:XP_013754153.1 erythrocyte band 7 integral membrane protein [Thecamonas trahens ATCC 50062]